MTTALDIFSTSIGKTSDGGDLKLAWRLKRFQAFRIRRLQAKTEKKSDNYRNNLFIICILIL